MKYALLGNGVKGQLRCPEDQFLYELEDTQVVEFIGQEMSCSKMVHVKCGAPSIQVKNDISVDADQYHVWFLEYDLNYLSKTSSETINLNPNYEYDLRKQ